MYKIFASKFSIIAFCIVLSSKISVGQTPELYNPLALPLAISGSFGEIRTDHFHSGIDFRTNGRTGFKVYASEAGFVSRIKVSAVGFGKTIYIEHPNGLTTVYAHLDRFVGAIAQYVEKEQYSQKSFEIELFPKKGELTVEKGEIIALSGNSGSSGGPHLHYEVRFTSSQVPMSPLKYFPNYKNADTSAPSIKSIYTYRIDSIGYLMDSLERNKLQFTRNKNIYQITDTIVAFGKIGIGVESFDFINEQSNRCGFQRITQTVNNQTTYKLNLDSFAFAETKYVNSIVDYRSKIKLNDEVVRLWVDENNKFSGIQSNKSNGFIEIENKKNYRIEIKVEDHSGNSSIIRMIVKGQQQTANNAKVLPNQPNISLLECNKEHRIMTDYYEIRIPKEALYHNILFSHSMKINGNSQTIYQINNSSVPIHKRFSLIVKQPSIRPDLINKYFIGYLNGKGIEYCDSKYINGTIEAICTKFGNYTLAVDTIPPKIKPLNFANKTKIEGENQIKIQLEDSTGIMSYIGLIDNNWALFEWDPKSKILVHCLDKNRTKKQMWHTLTLEVTDKFNNKSEFNCEFFW